MEEPQPLPQILSPCSSGRRRSTDAKSPEFEFWMLRNPSFPQPNLLSADELFSDGFLLPLRLLQQPSNHDDPPPLPPPPPPPQEDREKTPPPEQEPSNVNIDCTLTPSKRWSYIFKKSDKKGLESDDTKEKKRDQKKNVGGGAAAAAAGGVGGASSSRVSAAELNINIWPFSRSRSAGNGGTRPRPAAAAAATTRKVSSAPCSRSNSTGESKFRKWPPNSPSRAGVHLGRSSPVWKVRRGGGANGGRKDINEGRRKPPAASSKARVLSLNVPMCIGYRHHLSCTSDENSAVSVAAAAGGVGSGGESRIGGIVSGEVVRRSNLFNIRSLFTKKVY